MQIVHKLSFAAATLLLILLLTGLFAWPQNPAPAPTARERERRSLAVNILRAINAAEADYMHKHGMYADWATLTGNGDFTENGTKWAPESLPTVAHALYSRGAEITPGWKLRLNLSKAGLAYDLLLEDVTDPKCGYAALTDERGLIRQARSVDCPF